MSRPGKQQRSIDGTNRRCWSLTFGAIVVAAGLGTYALVGTGTGAAPPTARLAESQRHAPSAGVAPNGRYTTASGNVATIASLRGRPTMVWFVAGGCASCAASIPAVASHLDQLTRTGIRVLTLGLYGDFPPGKRGVSVVLRFGADALGESNARLQSATTASLRRFDVRPGWQWGMASKSLSLAYDPSGTPDLYVLIGRAGRIRYRNSVPVSTMGSLLAAAKRFDARV